MTDWDNLMRAIDTDDFDAAAAILERNNELTRETDGTGATALHYAALNGRRRIAQLLVEQGADVNCRDTEFGATPSGWAIEYLRELGGHLATELEDLAFAIETGDIKWAQRFLRRFPNLQESLYRNQTTFRRLAENSSNPQMIQLFTNPL